MLVLANLVNIRTRKANDQMVSYKCYEFRDIFGIHMNYCGPFISCSKRNKYIL